MIKIYFMPVWGLSSDYLFHLFKHQTPSSAGIWKDIQGVTNPNEADYFIVQDYSEIPIIDPKRTFYISREVDGGGPSQQYPNLKAYYTTQSYWLATKWYYQNFQNGGINKTYDELKDMTEPLRYHRYKERFLCISSDKNFLLGHKLRLKFIKLFCDKFPDKISLYGGISNLKFAFPTSKAWDSNKFELLEDYQYSLTFDNGQYDNYLGSQVTDAILSWSFPFYWGAPNVSEFLPEGSYEIFDIKKPEEEMERLVKLLDKNFFMDRFDALQKARDMILDKWNFWNSIHKFVHDNI